MKVAAYVRPWSIDYFSYLLPKAFPSAETIMLSDFRRLGDYEWSEHFHKLYGNQSSDSTPPYWLDHNTEFEIIIRDRLLRSIPLLEASRMLRAMSQSIKIMLDEVMPDALVSPSADSYVMDLLIRHCKSRNIPYCGLLPCPFPNYTRVTSIGEIQSFRTPTEDECSSAIAAVKNPAFQPVDLVEWLKMYGNTNIRIKRSLREIPKRYVFPIIGKMRKDPLNYHYMGSALSSVAFFSQAVLINRSFDSEWRSRIASWNGVKVYIPLQTYPECTTDYHVKEIDLIDFPRLLPRLLDALCLDKSILVCVKEHPGMMGSRPPGFYNEIRRHKNIVLINGDVPASTLIESTDMVLTWTGTGALECVLRGKPAITIGTPFYNKGPMYTSIRSLKELDNVSDLVMEAVQKRPGKNNDIIVASHILSGTFQGEFRFINFDKQDKTACIHAEELAESLKRYWEVWRVSQS